MDRTAPAAVSAPEAIIARRAGAMRVVTVTFIPTSLT